MKKRLKEEDAEKILQSDAFVGRIVRLSSVAESRLDILLSSYFSKGHDIDDFLALVAEQNQFLRQKLNSFEAELSKGIKSRRLHSSAYFEALVTYETRLRMTTT